MSSSRLPIILCSLAIAGAVVGATADQGLPGDVHGHAVGAEVGMTQGAECAPSVSSPVLRGRTSSDALLGVEASDEDEPTSEVFYGLRVPPPAHVFGQVRLQLVDGTRVVELDCDQATCPGELVCDVLLEALHPRLVQRALPTPRIERTTAGIRATATVAVHALIRDVMARIQYVPIEPHVLVAAQELHHMRTTSGRAERAWFDAALRAASQPIRDRVDRLEAARGGDPEHVAQPVRPEIEGAALNQVLRVRVTELTADPSEPHEVWTGAGPATSGPSMLSYTESLNLRRYVARTDGISCSAPILIDLRQGQHCACALASDVLLRIRFDGVSAKGQVALAAGVWTDRAGDLRFARMQALATQVGTVVLVTPEDGLTADPTCERIVTLLIEILNSDAVSTPAR